MVLLPSVIDGLQGGPKESTDAFILYFSIAGALVLLAGLMSGLTLGLLSLDHVSVEVRTTCCCWQGRLPVGACAWQVRSQTC